MKISDVLRSLVDIVDKNSTDETEVIGQDETSVFSGQLKPVVLPDVKSSTRVKTEEKTPAGNDKEPEDLFVSPLQMKMELLKKASGVQNIYDDGAPEQQEEDRIEKEGMWTGSDHQYDFVGAQTGAVESSTKGESKAETPDFGKAKDKAEDKDEETDTETKEDDKEEKKEKETATESFRRTLDMLALVEGWDDDDEDDDVRKADDELRKMGKKIEPAKINTDKDKIKRTKDDEEDLDEAKAPSMNRWGKKRVSEEKADKDYDDDGEVESEKDEVWGSRMRAAKKAGKMDEGCHDEEQLDELSPQTLSSYIKKAKDNYGVQGLKLGKLRADQDDIDRFTNRHMADKFGTRDELRKSMGATSGDESSMMRVGGNRSRGIDRAVDRLTRESDELDMECSQMESWGEKKLDELSLDTLGKYKDKASKDRDSAYRLAGNAASRGRGSDMGQFNRNVDRFAKRDAGIKRADAQAEKKIGNLEELSKKTLGKYARSSAGELAQHSGNLRQKQLGPRSRAWDGEHPKTGEAPIEWDQRKQINRKMGIDRAVDRLALGYPDKHDDWKQPNYGDSLEESLDRIMELARHKVDEAGEKKVDKESKATDNLVIFDELTSDHPTD